MSILNQNTYEYSYESLFIQVQEEMAEGALASTIIKNQQIDLFKNKLTSDNGWDWFRLILMSEVDWQLEWLEIVVLKGVPIDKAWKVLDTGHHVSIFDLIEQCDGGICSDTKALLQRMSIIYRILFLRQDIQPALDILEELSEHKNWISLNIVLSCYVCGPLSTPKPMLHYLVSMERYDLVRAMLTSATELHTEFDSDTFLPGWINMKDDEGMTVLHITTQQKRESWVKWFLDNHADVLVKDVYGRTPFNYVTEKKYFELFWNKCESKPTELLNELLNSVENVEALEWLLKTGANPNSPGAFKTAAKYPGFIPLLVRYGGDPSTVIPGGGWNDKVIVEWLLNGGIGSEQYSKFCIKYLSGFKSCEFICFLISLYHSCSEETLLLYKNIKEDERATFDNIILNIKPRTKIMKKYKSLYENVKNILVK